MTATATQARKVSARAEGNHLAGLWNLVVNPCPFCLGTHRHGAGTLKEDPDRPNRGYYGHRQAHCGGGEYMIVEETRSILPEKII